MAQQMHAKQFRCCTAAHAAANHLMFFQCDLPDDARVPQLQGLGHPPIFLLQQWRGSMS
jgi:hypothetical protein